MERYYVKVEDRPSDIRDIVPVVYSGDRYFDEQGFMYLIVQNPSIVDKWGMTGTKKKVDVEPEEAPPALNKPNLKLQRINDMTRINTDNTFLGLYKYDGGEHTTYYRCEDPLVRELTDIKRLYVFTYEEKDAKMELIMADKYGRTYVNIDPKELGGYTYFEGPLPNYYFTPPKPEPFVRPTKSVGYSVFPDVKPMTSFGRTTHLGGGTYSRDTHVREPMSCGERDADARSMGKILFSLFFTVPGSSEKEDNYIRKFDGTNFTIWKQRMMDVLVNKGLAAPLKEHKEGVYNDDQWEELDAKVRATICLHLGESIFFTIMDKTTTFKLRDSLCSAWDGKSASNKVFLMKKLMRLSMKEGSSVSFHLNEFNALYLQLTSKELNFDDEMKAIFLLCSLPVSWDAFNTTISNSTHGGKLAFGDVTSALLTEEI
ncbi:hypothetical protein L7F22_038569 [Adiantum nelumboides]|nr:hypothetical protein [Adiantum nelumboides]